MLAEIGHLLLIISSALAINLCWVAWLGLRKKNNYILSFVSPLCLLQALALFSCLICLTIGFVINDFSISYVANHSNTQLAWYYRIAAVWGSHEGSMLFWVVLISLWAAIIMQSRHYTDKGFVIRMQAVLSALILGFNIFLLFTSNPFARNLPQIPVEGRNLNPILQDIGLILHPPLLFLGYVGLIICFAAALAALWAGKLEQRHASYLRPWALLAWVFLTGGNAFGSWWAYNELGWGGWWFWDPVENAAFIPWLIATALVHSLWLTSQQGLFKLTSLFLCLLAFSLSLLGTFLVRSGIVQSVHAFASDPTRGMSILVLLLVFVGAALLLFALKAPKFSQVSAIGLYSKTTGVLLAIAILVVAAMSVLLGTFYPLMYELLGLGTLSVGAPYFNSIFVPLTFICVLVMGWVPLMGKQGSAKWPALALVSCWLAAAGILILSQQTSNLMLWLGAASALWLLLSLGWTLWRQRTSKQPFTGVRIGMLIAHFGVAISIIGATGISNYEQEALLRMAPGQGKPIGDYTFIYRANMPVDTASYTGIQAQIEVLDSQERSLGFIYPERQTFKTNGMEVSQAGVSHGFFKDLYVSKGVQLSDTEYLIRISIKPLAMWIWAGGLLMMLGGLICVFARPTPTKAPTALA
ncbi:heme lyase CcmF/NrfE family subunit [Shewanella sp. NIFS-20-20]|uniref:heme lyase CcmF/NrfE family subunit n=1 Tax=Shewanella sp. NIFS-20-20 TaxID=2853806 RepID=UPI001C489B33|nr:heme lyase CcmF/NrfE family subunit [Shewanella sp. NIFS-20-20]MBV7316966.1 heme lyase CcmF/NrfE family subunit [Shewanella sp. NIFS-20-20]